VTPMRMAWRQGSCLSRDPQADSLGAGQTSEAGPKGNQVVDNEDETAPVVDGEDKAALGANGEVEPPGTPQTQEAESLGIP